MKKVFLSLLLLIGVCSFSKAQSWDEGSQVVNVGLGFGSSVISGSSIRILPISGSFEYGIRDQWSIGGILGIVGSKDEFSFGANHYQYNYTHILIAARGAYHIYSDYNWDTYAGASLGFNIVSGSFSGTKPGNYPYSPQSSTLNLGLYAGARYYFNDQFAAFGELGYSIAFLNLGISYKIQ